MNNSRGKIFDLIFETTKRILNNEEQARILNYIDNLEKRIRTAKTNVDYIVEGMEKSLDSESRIGIIHDSLDLQKDLELEKCKFCELEQRKS